MDHYKTLGLTHTATKDEIKEAFRRSALKFHPDRHSHSPESVREGSSLQFKLASEAYQILIDDRKRAEYDRWRGSGGFDPWARRAASGRYYRPPPRPPPPAAASDFDFAIVFRWLTRRGLLVNLAFASALLGGAVLIERSADTIWKMNNSGKSFEEAMESIEKGKAQKGNSNRMRGVLHPIEDGSEFLECFLRFRNQLKDGIESLAKANAVEEHLHN